MAEEIRLDAADFITIGTVGPPGKRVFHLQARQGNRLLTLIIEKEQAAAIARGIDTILAQVREQFKHDTPTIDTSVLDLDLQEPILPLFRVGMLGLGYDPDADRLVLLARELLPEDTSEEPRLVQITATREQMRALAQHAEQVVAAGRPICASCGQPIDPEGHFCPRSNGHRRPIPGT